MPNRPAATLLTALLLAVATAACAVGPAPTAGLVRDTAARSPVVTGYALAGDAAPATITRDGDLVDTVGVDGVVLLAPDRVSAVDADAQALRDAAHRAGRTAVLLVSNHSDGLGDFDERLAHRVLASASHRRAVARALARRAAGFDGVQLDLEALAPRDRSGLTALTRAVRRALPARTRLSMAVSASDDAAGYRAGGYDLPALARVLDVVVLMSYDQHGPWSQVGPVGALPWVRGQLRTFLRLVPRSKVDLGAAAYGYQWGGGPSELSVPRARELAGSAARWDATAGEWTAALPGGRTLWWDDARSVDLRRRLAAQSGLHGLAVWQLGTSGALTP
ncbi:hypothetical protein GCM10027596_10750 [Nocardioides korecus]